MHPGAGEHSKTVVNALLSRFKVQEFSDTSRPGVVHRLDKDTTGLVVLAKDPGTMAKLSGQFAEKIARRTYIALVTSTSRSPICESGTIDINLVRSPRNRKEFVTSNNKGKHAITHFKVLEYFKNGTLLELKLETGRTHQIRVHLKYMGHPVVGDKTYGTKGPLPAELKKEVESFGRQALHAKSLSLFHPKTEKLMTFFVDPPDDFISLISKFRNYK